MFTDDTVGITQLDITQTIENMRIGFSNTRMRCWYSRLCSTVKPSYFLVLTRAVHLPPKTKTRLGIDIQTLICAGADLIEHRQSAALLSMIGASKKSLHDDTIENATRNVNVNSAHAWDEVRSKFTWRPSPKYRARRKATQVPTLVQKGVVCLFFRAKL